MELAAFTGVTLREVRTSNSDIADAINLGRLSPIAAVDAEYAGGLHVSITPPAPLFEVAQPAPNVDPEVVTEEVGNGFDSLLNWLEDLLGSQFDVQIPGLADLGTGQLTSVIDNLGLTGVLTGQNSIASLLSTLTGAGNSLTVGDLASQLDGLEFTNTGKTWTVSAQGQFEESSGLAAIHVQIDGAGTSDNLQIDFGEALAEIGCFALR